MKSRVAESVRRSQREEILRLPPEERVKLGLRLGERCVRIFAEAQKLSFEEAKNRIVSRKQRRRRG